jgi:hypothetical protein
MEMDGEYQDQLMEGQMMEEGMGDYGDEVSYKFYTGKT